jgi:hypothetical protein
MPLSQFEPTLNVSTSSGGETLVQAQIPEGVDVVEVGGPLELGAPEDYVHPIIVQFLLVQTPEGDHTGAFQKRARGVGQEVEDSDPPVWRGTVKLGDLVVGPGKEKHTETRGVAVAVLERSKQFAFDTITWCDHVELLDGTTAAQPRSTGALSEFCPAVDEE